MTQANTHHPPYYNDTPENPGVRVGLSPFVHDLFKAIPPAPVIPPTLTTITTLNVIVQTPKYKDGAFHYRERIIAQVSLTGTALMQFDQVVLGPMRPNDTQLVLWCFAQCGSCISFVRARCNPTGWYLDPSSDPKYNQAFILNRSRERLTGNVASDMRLTGNVAFDIQLRPKRPQGQDQTRRCNSESLM